MTSDGSSAANAYAYLSTSDFNLNLTDAADEVDQNDIDDPSDVFGPGPSTDLSDPAEPIHRSLHQLSSIENVSTASSFSSTRPGLSPLPPSDISPETTLPTSMQYLIEEDFAIDDAFLTSAQESRDADNHDFAAEYASLTTQQYLFPETHSDSLWSPWGEFTDMQHFADQFEAKKFFEIETTDDLLAPGQQLTQDLYQPFMASDVNMLPWDAASAGAITQNIHVLENPSPPSSTLSTSSHWSTQSLRTSESSSLRPPVARSEASSKLPTGSNMQQKMGSRKPATSGEFVIMTPATIGANSLRLTSSEHLDRTRTTQRGRKGPLKTEIKTSALQIRKVGACHWCRLRKVKCDKERPCQHCKKLQLQLPQVLCWRYTDLMPVLLPAFLRTHLKREGVLQLLAHSIQDETFNGADKTFDIYLSSHPKLASVMKIKAKLFIARDRDDLLQWHWSTGADGRHLVSCESAPLFLASSSDSDLDELREVAKRYIDDLIQEPAYIERVTDSFGTTQLPAKILAIVRKYALETHAVNVNRMLFAYTLYYVLTRHLCLSRQSIISLAASGVVPQDASWVTCRILARQIKSLLDTMMGQEIARLCEDLTQVLRSRDKRDWASSMAAFLLGCFVIEAVEISIDNFIVADIEIHKRYQMPCKYRMSQILEACRALENLPFMQSTLQFHYTYQSHSRDASARGFNPLADDSWIEQGELEGADLELVTELRKLLFGESWQELQFLAADDMIINMEKHPPKNDRSMLYYGRLMAKFLISFFDETILSESRI